MRFKETLLQGVLIKRYKRFFVDIKYNSTIIIAHCPNTGSMKGLLKYGNKVWFSRSNNSKRKLKYTLEIIEVDNNKIGVNTHLSNKIVLDALQNKKIKHLSKFDAIKTEVKFGDHTRFDFFLSNKNKKCFLEIKNVTLFRNRRVAEFPDAITSRGRKHLIELVKAKKSGYQCCILYLVQKEECDSFKIADDIDKNYSTAFKKAKSNGVKVLCYNCKLSNEEIILNKQIKHE